jgi:uncharacterized protein (DUF1015 family)
MLLFSSLLSSAFEKPNVELLDQNRMVEQEITNHMKIYIAMVQNFKTHKVQILIA